MNPFNPFSMKNFVFFVFTITLVINTFPGCTQTQNKSSKTQDSISINIDSTKTEALQTDTFRREMVLEFNNFLSYKVDPKAKDVKIYWRDDDKIPLTSIENLKQFLSKKGKTLVFAMNAGMYFTNYHPMGLLVQEGKIIVPVNKKSAPNANFYQKPNGIFYIDTNHVAAICKTDDFVFNKGIDCATQSGPMLLIDGEMHPICKKGSTSLNTRNGVGILPDGRILFVLAMYINFYDFAFYFKNAGCKNALFLDGGISTAYLPEKNWTDSWGDFGPMIGVSDR